MQIHVNIILQLDQRFISDLPNRPSERPLLYHRLTWPW